MTHSEQLNELTAALVKAQGGFGVPKKSHTAKVPTKSGTSYEYRYSTLDELIDATRQALLANGLTAVQNVVTPDGGNVGVSTSLLHTSGQWIHFDPIVLPAGGTPQSVGAAVTYARRYSMGAALNVAAEEDSDAQGVQPDAAKRNTASAAPRAKAEASTPAKPQPDLGKPSAISDAQRKRLFAIAKEHGWHEQEIKALLKDRYQIDSSKEIPWVKYDEIIRLLQAGIDSLAVVETGGVSA